VSAPRPPGRAVRRLPWRRVEFAALDFEATGLDFQRDTIVSFGVVPISGGRIDFGDSVYELVDPGEVPPPHESVTIHGLRPVDLRGAPSLDAARSQLADLLDERWLVTWWAGVEASFLAKMFGGRRGAWLRRSIDVRRLVLELEGDSAARLTLSQAAERFDVPVASPHHALDDALVTAQLFLVTATKLNTIGFDTLDELSRAGAPSPALRRPRAW
jgi:DNA polymerase III subunit epsilon